MSEQRAQRPTSPEAWIRRMRDWGIRPARSKGQNFLLDAEVVTRIADAAGIVAGDTVVEIGPGLGILTEELLGRGANVTAVELDDTLSRRLRTHFAGEPRFTLVHADATTVDVATIAAQPYDLVANLPYGVASVILRHFLESPVPPRRCTVMVQREVAERMAAGAGGMSLLGLAIQIHAEPTIIFNIPPDAFEPPPRVTSSVIRLAVRARPLLEPNVIERLFTLATIAFNQRRKTLRNTLGKGLGRDLGDVEATLIRLGIDPELRPQQVPLDGWLALATADDLAP